MAAVPSGSHTYNNPVANDHARMFSGDVRGQVHMGDNIYYGSSPTDFHTKLIIPDKCLAAIGAVDPNAVMRDITARKYSPLSECYSWIEDDPNVKRWDEDATCRLLRIGGDPGKGKTMLMISLVQKLEAMRKKPPTTYFFCQSTDSRLNSAISVLQGLIWHLVTSNPELGDVFDNTFRTRGEKPFCNANADFAELSELLSKLLSHSKATRINVLVDALDECDVDKDKLLRFIAEDSKSAASKAKWLVSSRNHRNIEEALDSPDDNVTTLSLELNSAHVAQAVSSFIEIQVKELAFKKKLAADDTQMLMQELKRKADATFLWVALVLKELEKAAAWEILEIAKAIPDTLTSFYGRMLQQMMNQRPREAALCKSVIRAVILAQRPLSLPELGVTAGLPEREFSSQEHISELVRSCASFLDIRDDVCYFVHQSAKDFFLDSNAGKVIFEDSLEAEHEHIVCRSLDAMSKVLVKDDICSLGHPGSPPLDDQKISTSLLWPIRYACTFWMAHLELSLEGAVSADSDQSGHQGLDLAVRIFTALVAPFNVGQPNVVTTSTHIARSGQLGRLRPRMAARILNFLAEKFLRWVEALANLRQLNVAFAILHNLEQLCRGMADTDSANQFKIDQFKANQFKADQFKDMERILKQCGVGVSEAPLQIYSSALVFAPLNSTTRQRFEGRCAAWLARPLPRVASQWYAALQTLERHSSWVSAVIFSPDGRRLASCSEDGTVRLWDANTGAALHTLEGHSLWVNAVTFSPDGRRLASCSDDSTVRLWDAEKGVALHTLKGHSLWVKAVTFSPDGKRLASCSTDKTVRLWDAEEGAALHTLESSSSPVKALMFSSDGQRLASFSEDKTVRLWDTNSGTALATSHEVAGLSTTGRSANHGLSELSVSPHGDWIVYEHRKLLWIPVHYRAKPEKVASHGSAVAIGCASGIVYKVGVDSKNLSGAPNGSEK